MTEHPVGQLPALRLFAHADAQPREILPAQKADDRAHAVVCARAALFAHAQLAQRQVDVVVDQKQVIHLRLIPRNQLRHALAGEVHKRLRLDEHQLFPADEALADLPIKVYAGTDAICQIVEDSEIDIVLTAMVGYAGLKPTMNAIRARKPIALANKETLVVAGELINDMARLSGTPILPVDSEHSAVFQCLAGELGNPIEKVILTASGGPFRNCTMEQLATVTKAQALKHPNWDMGAKITIDSASMMNKGFEVIEAKWLFGVRPDQIEVVVHPQSIIHSMVQFEDGAVKAQLGMPDMRLPIQYAFSYPHRLKASFPRLDFKMCTNLTFEQPDTTRFRNLALAYEALHKGGNMPCIVNAANEVVVAAFLRDEISFLGMSDVIEKAMSIVSFVAKPEYEDYVATDAMTRRIAQELIK